MGGGFAGDWDQDPEWNEDNGIRHLNDGWDYPQQDENTEDQDPPEPEEDEQPANRGWFGDQTAYVAESYATNYGRDYRGSVTTTYRGPARPVYAARSAWRNTKRKTSIEYQKRRVRTWWRGSPKQVHRRRWF